MGHCKGVRISQRFIRPSKRQPADHLPLLKKQPPRPLRTLSEIEADYPSTGKKVLPGRTLNGMMGGPGGM